MPLRALLIALALAACGPANQAPQAPPEPEAPDPFVMQNSIGRYVSMMDQVQEVMREHANGAELEPTDPRALARHLREVVWAYNLQRSRLCGRGILPEASCGPAYSPVWLNEPADAAPAIDVLHARVAAVDAEVVRFWDAVCADARAQLPEAEQGAVCAIE